MPIQARYKWLYPFDWPQLSAMVRFERAQGWCETCGRPHRQLVVHLGDGRWWDQEEQTWPSGQGRPLPRLPALVDDDPALRTTRVILAAAHLERFAARGRLASHPAIAVRHCIFGDRLSQIQ